MDEAPRERLTITIDDTGVAIGCAGKETVDLSAAEALMLLDILRNEQDRLERIARKSSPLPFCIKLR